jgi:acyl carrier protein
MCKRLMVKGSVEDLEQENNRIMKEAIRSYLVAHGAGESNSSVSDDESLLEAGVIDSVVMVDLISHLEATYGIRVDEDDMIPENFDSINAIALYIEQKQ